MKPNAKRVELFIRKYLDELTKNANAGLLPWAKHLSHAEFDSRVSKIVQDAALSFLLGEGSLSSGPAVKSVARQLKIRSAKQLTAWMFEEDLENG